MEISEFLSKTFLFKGLTIDLIEKIITEYPPVIEKYSRTEIIGHDESNDKRVGFILEGKCEVIRSKSDGSHTVLNVLTPCDSFGILSVLADEEYSTQVYVINNSSILYFSKQQINDIVNNYSQISMNIIKFLANRIGFLNRKIETFSGTRVENRLASYLLSRADSYRCDSFPFNIKKCSEAINAGRASVYRILDSFMQSGLITLVDKKIYINDRKGLERIKQ